MSQARHLLSKFVDVQPLPHIVATVSKLIADQESTMKDFEDVIKMDPVLVSRLLRLINSPYYGLAQAVTSIGRAVAYLGMKNLHTLIVVDAMKTIFVAKEGPGPFSRKRLWMHSAAVSICAKLVAERIFAINGDDAFLSGILHDFGLLVEDQMAQSVLQRICASCSSSAEMVATERQELNTDHGEIGYLLSIDWKMEPKVGEAIRDHHLLSLSLKPESLTGILQLAEYLAGRLGHSVLSGVTAVISEPLLTHLQDNLDEYQVLLEDLPEELRKAEAIYE
jgi:HD-like signal output (HDOD) protein